MNVFALTTWCPFPLVNGSTLREYYLLRALAAVHAVDLMTFSAPDSPSAADLQHLRSFCRSVEVIPRSPFTPLAAARSTWWSTVPKSLGATDDPELQGRVAAAARGADVAVGFQLSAARFVARAGVPAVFEEAEPGQIRNRYQGARTVSEGLRLRFTWWKHARYIRRLVAPMAAVTVASEDERRALVALGVDTARVHIVPNGADAADLTRPRVVATPARVIYPGAVTYAPNLEAVEWFLAAVMPRIRAARPDVELWVTGDTGDLRLDRLPNRECVRFTGRLPDVKDAVGGSTATVVPLMTGGGTRLKVLESLALGTPVVSTTKGAEGLDLRDGEHLLIADSPDALAAHVLSVVNDPALAARLSANGRARVRQAYSWDAIGDAFCSVVASAARAKERL